MIDILIRRDAIPCLVESNTTAHSGHCILTGRYVVVITNKFNPASKPIDWLIGAPSMLSKYPQHRFVICSAKSTPINKNPYVGFVIQTTNHNVIVFPFVEKDYALSIRQAILHNQKIVYEHP